MKICSICKEQKNESEYYKKGVLRGKQRFRSDCKDCHDKTMSILHKMNNQKASRAYKARNLWRIRVQDILHIQMRKGGVLKPNKCSVCGKVLPIRFICGHHDDYEKPLDVRWVCHKCHTNIHKN